MTRDHESTAGAVLF